MQIGQSVYDVFDSDDACVFSKQYTAAQNVYLYWLCPHFAGLLVVSRGMLMGKTIQSDHARNIIVEFQILVANIRLYRNTSVECINSWHYWNYIRQLNCLIWGDYWFCGHDINRRKCCAGDFGPVPKPFTVTIDWTYSDCQGYWNKRIISKAQLCN